MSWNQMAYTTAGAEILADTLLGRRLTISRADAGPGLYDESELPDATSLASVSLDLHIFSITDASDDDKTGKKIGIQILNEGLTSSVILHQIGVYGTLDSDPDTEVLLFILQDEYGVEVPSEIDTADFELDVYAVVAISNTAQITLKVDSDARASRAYVDSAIAAHNEASDSHAEQITERIENRLATGKHYIIDNDNATSYLYSLEVTNGELVLVYDEANT